MASLHPRCDNCRFWAVRVSQPAARNTPGPFGTCRRKSPTHDPQDRIIGDFPGAPAHWWCGEWQPRDDAGPGVEPVARRLALAVLGGDLVAARALADWLIEVQEG